MGTMGSFPGSKARLGCDADHIPHLVPRSTMSRSYTSSTPWHLYGVAGQLYFTRHFIGLLWTSNQPVAKASTYAGQQTAERQGQTPMLEAGFKPTISASKRSRPTHQTARPLGLGSSLVFYVISFNCIHGYNNEIIISTYLDTQINYV
jgi:hypothetical protein